MIFGLLNSKNLCVKEFIFPKMIIANVFTSLNISPQDIYAEIFDKVQSQFKFTTKKQFLTWKIFFFNFSQA